VLPQVLNVFRSLRLEGEGSRLEVGETKAIDIPHTILLVTSGIQAIMVDGGLFLTRES